MHKLQILYFLLHTEKSASYINTEGRVQSTLKAAPSVGEAKEDWEILNHILASVSDESFQNKNQLYKKLYSDFPHLSDRNVIFKECKISDYVGQLSSRAMTNFVPNYYMTNPINRAQNYGRLFKRIYL